MKLFGFGSKQPTHDDPARADWEQVTAYHNATKHHFYRFATSLGYLDWATQPDPFRRFPGAPLVPLPLAETDETPGFDELYRPTGREPRPLSAEAVGTFFELSLALSAWKEFRGNRWALRVNPSSGNLHPTEAYAILPALAGIHQQAGVQHYAAQEHGLEQRTEISPESWEKLTSGFPKSTFFVGLTSIFWREAWKYGERAFRYCQIDLGHALAAISYAAAVQGWQAVYLDEVTDPQLAAFLGVDRHDEFHPSEREHPEALVAIFPPTSAESEIPLSLPADQIQAIAQGQWLGKANQLSPDHVPWPVLEAVATASCYNQTKNEPVGRGRPETFPISPSGRTQTAREIILQRRSAVDFDGQTAISASQFFTMLGRTLPASGNLPWGTFGSRPLVHLFLFVHRVTGLEPGIYILVRNAVHLAELKAGFNPVFSWEKPSGCPPELDLYLLESGDFTSIAAQVSCRQNIAGDSAFSLGMLARFEPSLRETGAWMYRRLFWETGVIGQVLYLEAEAAGVRGTGIGCFFDDPVHTLAGLTDHRYQSLYHFTVGGPLEDRRLLTRPPYAAERRREIRPPGK